jgi:HK97 family phage prohead protease
MTAMLEDRDLRARIIDVREVRRLATPLEIRTDSATGHIVLEGYASTFDAYDVHGGPEAGGWTEQLTRTAFDKTLAGRPDVQLLINHEGLPIARTASATQPGNLFLRADSHGLLVRADLDPSDPDVQRIVPKMRSRGGARPLLDEMSFAFHVRGHEWTNDFTTRMISEVDLRKGDVSIVNYGMNPNTHAVLDDAVGALAQLSHDGVLELRSMDHRMLSRAAAVLREASKPKKYADVTNFADPGYLDSEGNPAKGGNGVKRYPLNSAARVRNAAARFAQNKGKYSSSQQSAIMGKIRSAAKSFGVEISEEKSMTGFSTSPTLGPDPRRGFAANIEGGALRPNPSGADLSAPMDPHTFPGYQTQTYEYDKGLGGRSDVDPGAGVSGIVPSGPDIPTAGGYDPHDGFKGKQTFSAPDDLTRRDDSVCPGGDNCPGDSCPDHGDGSSMGVRADDGGDRAQGDFGGKKAKPFGSDDDDEDRAAALSATLLRAARLAPSDEMRALIGQARSQFAALRGEPGTDTEIDRRMAELRALTGAPPETMNVDDALRALREAG